MTRTRVVIPILIAIAIIAFSVIGINLYHSHSRSTTRNLLQQGGSDSFIIQGSSGRVDRLSLMKRAQAHIIHHLRNLPKITPPPLYVDGQRQQHHGNYWMSVFTILPDVPSLPSPTSNPQEAFEHLKLYLGRSLIAILSWRALNMEVIAFGSESACDVINQVFLHDVYKRGLICRPIFCKEDGIPTLDCPFREAQRTCTSDILMYSNTDIVFFPSLKDVVFELARVTKGKFVAVGKRVDIEEAIVKQISDGFLEEMRQCLLLGNSERNQCDDLIGRHFKDAVEHNAYSHDRNGVDFLIFHRDAKISLPKFFVGRIQWDQWLLLKLIIHPELRTVEISHATTALHLGHGEHKASHMKQGTDRNVEIAKALPHRYVSSHEIIEMKGTVWLGRLDETEYVMYNDMIYSTRKRQFTLPSTLNGLQAGGVDILRIPLSDFEGKDVNAINTLESHRPFHLLPNSPSLDLLVFKAHSNVAGRRTILICPITTMHDIPRRLCLTCFAMHAKYEILFITTDGAVWQWMTTLGVTIMLHSVKSDPRNALLAAVDIGLKSMHYFYSFAILEPHVLLSNPLQEIVGPQYTKSKADDVVVFSFGTQEKGGMKGNVILTRPSTHTFGMWNSMMSKRGGKDFSMASILSYLHVTRMNNVAYREEVVSARYGGQCLLNYVEDMESFHNALDKLYMSTRGHPLDGHTMLGMQSDVNMESICQLFRAASSNVGDGEIALFARNSISQLHSSTVLCSWSIV